MESLFSTVKSELADRFHTYGDAKMELFDYIEVCRCWATAPALDAWPDQSSGI